MICQKCLKASDRRFKNVNEMSVQTESTSSEHFSGAVNYVNDNLHDIQFDASSDSESGQEIKNNFQVEFNDDQKCDPDYSDDSDESSWN